MGLRPGRCYSSMKRPYTRVSTHRPRKSYVKGVPYPKIRSFEIGKPKPEYSSKFFLSVGSTVQIRHNSLEATRVAANKALERGFGTDMYFLKVLVFPHHVMRENAMATGAGADRFQTGMRLSFGKPIGTAARVKAGQRILEVRAPPGKDAIIKRALKIASSKLPVPCRIVAA